MKISYFCHISFQYEDICYFDLFNLSSLCIQRNIRPLKWSFSFIFKQITANQINMGNKKIYHISPQYADKCHFDLFNVPNLCTPRNIRPLKWSISLIFKQITVNQIYMGNKKMSHFSSVCK